MTGASCRKEAGDFHLGLVHLNISLDEQAATCGKWPVPLATRAGRRARRMPRRQSYLMILFTEAGI